MIFRRAKKHDAAYGAGRIVSPSAATPYTAWFRSKLLPSLAAVNAGPRIGNIQPRQHRPLMPWGATTLEAVT